MSVGVLAPAVEWRWTMGNRTMYGFEVRIAGSREWSAEACGHQGPDNYYDTEEAALAELPNLAECLSEPGYPCRLEDLRVVEIEVQS